MIELIRNLRSRLRASEAGFTMIELVAAIGIMAIGFFALSTTFTASARILVQSRQRQVATEEASGAIEHLRNLSYDEVALTGTSVTQSADPKDPDHDVDVAGTGYDYSGSGTYEPLIFVASGLVHKDPPIKRGPTAVTVYRFFTWIDDPVGGSTTEDYKRATIIVTYSAADNLERPNQVQVSALVTKGSVSVGGILQIVVENTSTPTPSATPTPTSTSASCEDDTTAPTGDFTILSGTGAEQGFTASTTATMSMAPVDDCTPILVQFSNDDTTYGSWITYDAANPSASWALTSGDGLKSVWANFRDGNGNQATVGPRTITLDTTLPTPPSGFSRTANCSGSTRTVVLSWGAASDTNLLGYRVYKQVNGGGWTVLATTAALTQSDSHEKTLDSVEYKVAAYDKAGNEGTATSVITLSKNQCS